MKNAFLCLAAMVMITHGVAQQVAEDPAARARKVMSQLTLERKVAQLICVSVSGDVTDSDLRVGSWITLAKEHSIGGFAIQHGTAERVAALAGKFKKASAIPAFIYAEIDNGAGQQFLGATVFPPPMAFSATRDVKLMVRAARAMAAEARAIGIDVTLSPTVDLASADHSPVSGVSFGNDLDVLNAMLKAYVESSHREGLLVTAKHFPGRGGVAVGSARQNVAVHNSDRKALDQHEFRAFRYAVDAGVDIMMTDHIAVPSLSGSAAMPATIDPQQIAVIRRELMFNGLILTGDLNNEYLINRYGGEELAVLALEAGHDIVYNPEDPQATIRAITGAVKAGRIKSAQIDSSVVRLLTMKFVHESAGKGKLPRALRDVVGTADHLTIAGEVADRSLTLLKNDGVLPLKKIAPAKFVHIVVTNAHGKPDERKLAERINKSYPGVRQFVIAPDQDKRIYADILRAAGDAEAVLVSLFNTDNPAGDNPTISRELTGVLNGMASSVPAGVIFVSFGDPYLIGKFPSARAFVVSYEVGREGDIDRCFDAVIRLVGGELKPTGKLPVNVSKEMPSGFGLGLP